MFREECRPWSGRPVLNKSQLWYCFFEQQHIYQTSPQKQLFSEHLCCSVLIYCLLLLFIYLFIHLFIYYYYFFIIIITIIIIIIISK